MVFQPDQRTSLQIVFCRQKSVPVRIFKFLRCATSARNPSRPLLMPTIGIPESLTRDIASKKSPVSANTEEKIDILAIPGDSKNH